MSLCSAARTEGRVSGKAANPGTCLTSLWRLATFTKPFLLANSVFRASNFPKMEAPRRTRSSGASNAKFGSWLTREEHFFRKISEEKCREAPKMLPAQSRASQSPENQKSHGTCPQETAHTRRKPRKKLSRNFKKWLLHKPPEVDTQTWNLHF